MIVPRKPASIICSPSYEVFQNTTLSGALTSNHGDLGQIYTRWLPNMSECILDFVHNGDKVFHTFIPHLRFGKKYTSPYTFPYTSIHKMAVSAGQRKSISAILPQESFRERSSTQSHIRPSYPDAVLL